MKITATSEKDFIRKYVSLLGSLAGFNPRETEVAVTLVLVYRRIQEEKANQPEGTPEEEIILDVMDHLKSPPVITNVAKYLGMPFTSFRNYVSKLKQKGFFVEGSINPSYLPYGNNAIIEVGYEEQ